MGNKCDLSAERKVDTSEGKKLAADYNIPFLEVSAKENLLINEVFQTLGKGIKERLIKEEQKENEGLRGGDKIRNEHDRQPKNKRDCCWLFFKKNIFINVVFQFSVSTSMPQSAVDKYALKPLNLS